jgi:hypothetical protein
MAALPPALAQQPIPINARSSPRGPLGARKPLTELAFPLDRKVQLGWRRNEVTRSRVVHLIMTERARYQRYPYHSIVGNMNLGRYRL